MIWKRKPYWSWGRLIHFAEAFAITWFCGWVWGDAGLAAGTILCVTGGAVWETANHWWPHGGWMFADMVDFLFFVLGSAAVITMEVL